MATKTPEMVRAAMVHCAHHELCAGCPLEGNCDNILIDGLAVIDELRTQIALMKVQMHGDCGVCKHRAGNSFDDKGVYISDKCGECMTKETRPHWEYEGLPEVESK